jgi:hypothetical protein
MISVDLQNGDMLDLERVLPEGPDVVWLDGILLGLVRSRNGKKWVGDAPDGEVFHATTRYDAAVELYEHYMRDE